MCYKITLALNVVKYVFEPVYSMVKWVLGFGFEKGG